MYYFQSYYSFFHTDLMFPSPSAPVRAEASVELVATCLMI